MVVPVRVSVAGVPAVGVPAVGVPVAGVPAVRVPVVRGAVSVARSGGARLSVAGALGVRRGAPGVGCAPVVVLPGGLDAPVGGSAARRCIGPVGAICFRKLRGRNRRSSRSGCGLRRCRVDTVLRGGRGGCPSVRGLLGRRVRRVRGEPVAYGVLLRGRRGPGACLGALTDVLRPGGAAVLRPAVERARRAGKGVRADLPSCTGRRRNHATAVRTGLLRSATRGVAVR